MLLATDVGNTNITFAVFEDSNLRADWRISTQVNRTGDEYAAFLMGLFSEVGLKFANIDGAVISSVVPAAVDGLTRFCRKHLCIDTPLVLSPEMDLGMKVRYSPVTDVGADRIANAIAAHEKYAASVIVVDFGTATTLDAVSAEGEYLGGAIAPGIQISLEALLSHAAKLSGVSLVPPAKAIGESTSASLQSGMVFGFAGQVDALVDRFQDEMGGQARVIATGGLAPLIAEHSRTIEECDELITLEGLRIIYNRLRK